MTPKQQIDSLAKAMTKSKRPDGTEFYHFADGAPESLKKLFLEHYNVHDIDYETFSDACHIVFDIFTDNPEIRDDDEITDEIYSRADTASVYTSERLGYLTMHNEADISDTMREYGLHSIADACAVWYDRQVEQAAVLIKDWIIGE